MRAYTQKHHALWTVSDTQARSIYMNAAAVYHGQLNFRNTEQ